MTDHDDTSPVYPRWDAERHVRDLVTEDPQRLDGWPSDGRSTRRRIFDVVSGNLVTFAIIIGMIWLATKLFG